MIKLIITLIVILIVAIGGGYFLYSSFTNPKVISENDEVVLSCSDSDGNYIFVKGSTDYVRQEGEERSLYTDEDYCDYFHPKTDSRVGLLRESWCEENVLKQILTTCGRGLVCRQGMCVKSGSDNPICTDSDGGKNINVRGNIVGYGGTGRDECWLRTGENIEDGGYTNECSGESCYVYEYFCRDNDWKEYEIILCAGSCENGICI